MLNIVVTMLVVLFVDFAFAQPTQTASPQPPAAVQSDQAVLPTAQRRISKLPIIFEGRWERTFSNFRQISNTTKFVIASQDETGKIVGTFTSLGVGSFACGTVNDVPMEGEYDGKTLIIRATPTETGCNVWRLTLVPGGNHMFEWKSTTRGDTIGAANVAGTATAYYDAVK